MPNQTDERAALHSENVRVKTFLNELADLAAEGRGRRRPAGPQFDVPADPRVSTTPTLRAPAAALGFAAAAGPAGNGFFDDFGADAAPDAVLRPPPLGSVPELPPLPRGEYPSESSATIFAVTDELPESRRRPDSGSIDFNPTDADLLDARGPKNTADETALADTPAPKTPTGEAINDVLDDFNW